MVEASDAWWEKFDARKSSHSTNPERAFLELMVKNALSNHHRKHRMQNAPLDEAHYGIEDPKDRFDEDETHKDAAAEKEDIDQEFIDSRRIRSKPIKFGEKFYPYDSFIEIFRYYSLTDKLEYTSADRTPKAVVVHVDGGPAYTEILQPKIKSEFQHNKEAFVSIHEGLISDSESAELLIRSNSTKYYKRRWEILGSAEKVRWMELAISKLRESKEKKRTDLAKIENDIEGKREIEKAPILSAVVVCADRTFFTCFKGQVTETDKADNLALHWKKHCEYSLFVHVVKEENMHLLKGGTLYVTLEPCNKRNPIGVAEGAKGQPKIPCAVRCVEAGLENIYLGSFDYHERVLGKGREILETGEYKFILDKGKHIGADAKEIKGAELLEEYLKKYPLVASDRTQRTYKIGEPINIQFFDRDLMKEVYDLNVEFQRKHKPAAFDKV